MYVSPISNNMCTKVQLQDQWCKQAVDIIDLKPVTMTLTRINTFQGRTRGHGHACRRYDDVYNLIHLPIQQMAVPKKTNLVRHRYVYTMQCDVITYK